MRRSSVAAPNCAKLATGSAQPPVHVPRKSHRVLPRTRSRSNERWQIHSDRQLSEADHLAFEAFGDKHRVWLGRCSGKERSDFAGMIFLTIRPELVSQALPDLGIRRAYRTNEPSHIVFGCLSYQFTPLIINSTSIWSNKRARRFTCEIRRQSFDTDVTCQRSPNGPFTGLTYCPPGARFRRLQGPSRQFQTWAEE